MCKVQLTHTKINAEATLLCVRLMTRLLSVRGRKRLTSQSKCKKEKRERYRNKKVQRGKGIIRKGQGQKRNSLREQEQRVPIKQATIILFQFY
jgi:hypothetical protein